MKGVSDEPGIKITMKKVSDEPEIILFLKGASVELPAGHGNASSWRCHLIGG